jgi:hypothetical protein
MNFPTHYYKCEQGQPYKSKESFLGDLFDIG